MNSRTILAIAVFAAIVGVMTPSMADAMGSLKDLTNASKDVK